MGVRVDGFGAGLFVFQVALIILYILTTSFFATNDVSDGPNSNTAINYQYTRDVTYMMLFGFGFLMTFLRKATFTSTGMTFMITVIGFEWAVLVIGFFLNVAKSYQPVEDPISWVDIPIGMFQIINGNFAVIAVLISFGAIIGYATPLQLLVMTFFELVIYGINFYVGTYKLGAIDVGGSVFIHTFGAYFGLTVAAIIKPKEFNHTHEKSTPYNDTFAMIGTMFLWILWPSFNSAIALVKLQSNAAVNTMISIAASGVAAFSFSRIFTGGKFDMVHIQNSTLAGGVAVGASADILPNAGWAMLVGTLAGMLSVVGYVYVGPFVRNTLKIRDTCGINSLHGMPGLLGSAIGCIVVAHGIRQSGAFVGGEEWVYNDLSTTGNFSDAIPYSELFVINKGDHAKQVRMQIANIFVTLGFAIGGGIFTGLLMKLCPAMPSKHHYSDKNDWHVSAPILPFRRNNKHKSHDAGHDDHDDDDDDDVSIASLETIERERGERGAVEMRSTAFVSSSSTTTNAAAAAGTSTKRTGGQIESIPPLTPVHTFAPSEQKELSDF